MSFSYSSGVITQTGTDTDLSGLSGLTGVTTTTTGPRTVYSIDSSTRIVFDGTCTIDPRVNELETNRTGGQTIVVNGTLNIGLELTYTYGTQYTSGRALNIIGGSSAPWVGIFDVNGTLNWYGCEVETGSAINVENGGTIKIRDGVFISRLGNHTIQQGNTIIFKGGSTADILGLKKTLTGSLSSDNSAINIIGTFTTTNLSGVVSTGSVVPDNRSTTLAPVPFAVVSNFERLQLGLAGLYTNLSHFIDCASWDTSSPVSLNRRNSYGTVTRQGQAEFYRNCNGKIVFNGVGLQGVKLYWKDVDNGNRGITAATEWGQTYNSYREYNATTDVNGDFTKQVLEAAFYVTDINAPENTTATVDDRTESGHKITFNGYKYGYGLFDIQFQGNRIVASEATQPVVVDVNITEATKATVDAYVTLDNAQEFYDKAASYFEDNFGTYTSLLVMRSGDTIDAGSYNVTIDATAGSAFAFDGSTITIKASTFTGNITTTGTFTLSNGAVGVGTFISSAGTQTSISLTFNNLTNSFVEIFDNAGASVQRYTNQTGSLVYITPLGSTGTWAYIIDRPGYRPITSTFDPTMSNLIIDGVQEQLITAQGNPMYTGSTSPFVTITYDFVTPQLSIEVGDSAVSPQVIIDEVEQSLITVNGMRWQKENSTLVTFDDLPGVGPILFLQDNIRLKRASAGDVNSAVNGYVLSSQGVVLDGVNGNVNYIASPDYATPVWGALLSSHNVSSSFGELIQALETKSQADTRQSALINEHNDTQAKIDTIDTNVDAILVDTGTTIPTQISNLNDFNPATDTVARVTLVDTTTSNTDMRGTDGANTIAPDNAGIAAIQTDIAALNDFNPATDTVARVTLVDTTTVNTDMRGTDGANTIAPDNAGITAILVDTGTTIPNQIANLNDFNPATDTVARVTLVDTTTVNTDMRGTDGANTVAPDNAGITAIQADIAALNNISVTDVKAQADQALVDYGTETKTQADARQAALITEHNATQADIAALNNISVTDVKAQADQALTDYGTDTKTNVKPSVSI